MDQSYTSETQKESKLSESTCRLSNMSTCLSDIRMNLNSLSDRLIGSYPECPIDLANPPAREGAIGHLEDEIDKLSYQVNEVQYAVNRIVTSGDV